MLLVNDSPPPSTEANPILPCSERLPQRSVNYRAGSEPTEGKSTWHEKLTLTLPQDGLSQATKTFRTKATCNGLGTKVTGCGCETWSFPQGHDADSSRKECSRRWVVCTYQTARGHDLQIDCGNACNFL